MSHQAVNKVSLYFSPEWNLDSRLLSIFIYIIVEIILLHYRPCLTYHSKGIFSKWLNSQTLYFLICYSWTSTQAREIRHEYMFILFSRFGRMARPCLRTYSTQTSPIPSSMAALPPQIRKFVEDQVALCQPDRVHICDGSDAESSQLMSVMQQAGQIKPLRKHKNW